MTHTKRLMIGNTLITAKVAQQLIPTGSVATQKTDTELRQSIFSDGVRCANSGGKRGDCPWQGGVAARWWQEGFDYAGNATNRP